MYRGFFCFLQMKNRQFKRSRGRQLFWLCFDVGVVALHGALDLIGNVHDYFYQDYFQTKLYFQK